MKTNQTFKVINLTDLSEIPEIAGSEIREPTADRPWIFTNMVSTLDGAAVIDGTSGAMSSPTDRMMFRSLRAQADVILVGAGTARAEQYRLPREPSAELAAQREARSQDPEIALMVVSRSSDTSGIPAAAEALESSRKQLRCGVPRFSIASPGSEGFIMLLQKLRTCGVRSVLCEGGPNLLGQLSEQDLVDEWNFSMAPSIAGGAESRPVRSSLPHHRQVKLSRLAIGPEGTVLGRYLTHSPNTPG